MIGRDGGGNLGDGNRRSATVLVANAGGRSRHQRSSESKLAPTNLMYLAINNDALIPRSTASLRVGKNLECIINDSK